MKLELNDNTSLMQIQEKFNKAFQYLWINFYYTNFNNTSNAASEKISEDIKLKSLIYNTGAKVINLDKNTSIYQLENDFWKILGLKVKVFRKSGNVWVETIFTGNWSLERQNAEENQIII